MDNEHYLDEQELNDIYQALKELVQQIQEDPSHPLRDVLCRLLAG